MFHKNKMISVCIGLVALNTFAGSEGHGPGNGGDAVVCKNGQEVYLLDYVEALGRNIQFSPPSGFSTPRQIVDFYLNRLSQLDDRGLTFRPLLEQLLSDIESYQKNGQELGTLIRFTRDQLNDIDDSKELILPKGCHKEQMVVQLKPRFAEERFLTIQSEIFFKMSPFQQAMTLVHEMYLRETLGLYETYAAYLEMMAGADYSSVERIREIRQFLSLLSDSSVARYVNSITFSDKFSTLTPQAWASVLNPLSAFALSFSYSASAKIEDKILVTGNYVNPVFIRKGDIEYKLKCGNLRLDNSAHGQALPISLDCRNREIFDPLTGDIAKSYLSEGVAVEAITFNGDEIELTIQRYKPRSVLKRNKRSPQWEHNWKPEGSLIKVKLPRSALRVVLGSS